MFYEFFVVGGLAFYLLMLLEFVVLWACMANQSGFGATLSVIAGAALLALFGNFNLFTEIKQNPLFALEIFGGWVAIGAAWSCWKFRSYSARQREKYDEKLAYFLKSNNVSSLTVDLVDRWQSLLECDNDFRRDVRVENKHGEDVLKASPLARRNKGRITTWAIYWPWSMSWAILHDFVVATWNEIFRFLHGFYQKIADASFSGTEVVIPKDKDQR
jgi:hypothetical protein